MNNELLQEKIYILEGLGCANCAAKMEQKIRQLPEVENAALTFATRQLKISAPNHAVLKDEIQQICQSIERGVTLMEKADQTGAGRSGDRNKIDSASHCDGAAPGKTVKTFSGLLGGHKAEGFSIVIGMLLFAGGLLTEHAKMIPGLTSWNASLGSELLPFLIFATAYILLGHQVLLTAARNISHGQIFDENFLMSLATIAAFCIGEFAEGVGVILFYRIGELFEHIAVERSRSQIMDAVDMRPETVALVNGDSIRIIPAESAKPGDILLVRPGDRIPLDGVVVDGQSRIDTSPVTGEPVPVGAAPGGQVISGCINGQGMLKIQVTHPLSESMVTKILDSVENAAAGKPKIDKFITRFARIYTPIVVLLAVLTAVVPSIITGEWASWIETAITFLVISCPCALVISVPLAFFSGIGAASKQGILFKGGLAMEALKSIKGIVMDKTGTITKGVFAVNDVSSFGDLSEQELLSLAASCEAASLHPVAVSITEAARERGLSIIKASSLEELAGMGIQATFDAPTITDAQVSGHEATILCGSKKLMDKYGVQLPESAAWPKLQALSKLSGQPELLDLPEASGTEILIAVNGVLEGRIMISDQLKEDSVKAVSELKTMGLVPAMLTGDNVESAAGIASALGISNVRASLLPDDKVSALRELRDEIGAVMFVGDGINDAPVLAGADVGAAMGSGADAAIEAADVVFMTSSLSAIPQAISIARHVGRIATQNIVFALGVKLLVILLGLAGFANIWAAVFADTGVAMLCILNSLRILWKKY